MRNLKLLHCAGGCVPAWSNGETGHFIAVDSLTSTAYVVGDQKLYVIGQEKTTETSIDLMSEGVLLTDQSDTVVGMEFLPDLQHVCITTSAGSVVTYDPLVGKFDTVACTPVRLLASCWSPDCELLVMVTENNEMLLMNRDFDVVNQLVLHPSGFGTDDLITVGWGKKETQFHGSQGKQAALANATVDSNVLDWDDRRPRISWRGDGQYFCISAIDPAKGRVVRVWSRDGIHCSTNEPAIGLGQCLAWKPSGSLIATSQNKSDSCQVIFYERNGLRHGEFQLSFDSASCRVKELAWNRESTILAVWLESTDDRRTFLQLYTTGNYHWYCKLTYSFISDDAPVAWCWDPDQNTVLHIAFKNGAVNSYTFAFVVHRHSSQVAVVDGKSLYLSDFQRAVIPPPMCQCTITAPSFINEVSFIDDGPAGLAILTDRDELATAVAGDVGSGDQALSTVVGLPIGQLGVVYHLQHVRRGVFGLVVFSHEEWLMVVCQTGPSDRETSVMKTIPLKMGVFQFTPLPDSADGLAVVEQMDGSFMVLTDQYELVSCSSFTKPLSSVSWQVETLVVDRKLYVVCLNDRFQMTVNGDEIANNVSSLCLCGSFLLFTTISHHLKCLPCDSLHRASGVLMDIDQRNIERGAKLVAAVADEGEVILQMPRGNLETIFPRALVLDIVKRLLDGREYKRALLMMRRHRVNLNLLYDHSPEEFLANMGHFVTEIGDAALLNLFISDLKNEDVTEGMYAKCYSRPSGAAVEGKVNRVCEQLRDALWKSGEVAKFCTSVLMTLVKMVPSQFDAALKVVKDLRDSDVDSRVMEDALQHLFYFVDAAQLFNVALGTYDFDLVLMVAEKSQKDPKEFLPFLTELQSLEPSYRKYKIDVHLARYEKALDHLLQYVKDDESKFDEFLRFTDQHALHVQAMRMLPAGSEQYKAVCLTYADYLVSARKYEEGAVSYLLAGHTDKAIEYYAKAVNWNMALALAHSVGLNQGKLQDLCHQLSRKLKDQRRFKDAALIEHEFLKDTKLCVGTLLEGGHYEEAVLRIYQSGEMALMETQLAPTISAACQRMIESIERTLVIFVQYKDRLAIVREQKKLRLLEINEKGHVDDTGTEFSTETGSTVTRSTSAYSSRSASSRGRRMKKQERKKYSLKEGNPYEDLGLIKALTEIVDQVNKMQEEVAVLLRTAAQLGLQSEGENLQRSFGQLREKVTRSINEIWPETLDLAMLPGPIEDQLTDENGTAEDAANRLSGILDSHFRIKLDENLVRPKLHSDSAWALSIFS